MCRCRSRRAPLHRGDPGYSSNLDRAGDGIACQK
nr:excalibur calcium-binding domain-containing protein [Nocardia inohanensis]